MGANIGQRGDVPSRGTIAEGRPLQTLHHCPIQEVIQHAHLSICIQELDIASWLDVGQVEGKTLAVQGQNAGF